MVISSTLTRPVVLLAVAFAVLACTRSDATAHENRAAPATPAGDAGPPKIWPGRGVIRAIDPNRHYVNIAHETIVGLMPAMTMPFDVERAALLDGLHVADPVTFTFHQQDDRLILDSLDRSAPDAGR